MLTQYQLGATGDGNSLVSAVDWIGSLLSGSIGSSISILAIAAFGIGVFAGRLSIKRATSLAIGIALIAGASALASRFSGLAMSTSDGWSPPTAEQAVPLSSNAAADASDPYAGAAVNQ